MFLIVNYQERLNYLSFQNQTIYRNSFFQLLLMSRDGMCYWKHVHIISKRKSFTRGKINVNLNYCYKANWYHSRLIFLCFRFKFGTNVAGTADVSVELQFERVKTCLSSIFVVEGNSLVFLFATKIRLKLWRNQTRSIRCPSSQNVFFFLVTNGDLIYCYVLVSN